MDTCYRLIRARRLWGVTKYMFVSAVILVIMIFTQEGILHPFRSQKQPSMFNTRPAVKSTIIWPYTRVTPAAGERVDDWSFARKTECPDFPLSSEYGNRKTLVLNCTNNKGQFQFVSDYSHNRRNLFLISFKSKCLAAAVERNCYDEKIVPNVVHYVWYNKPEFGYFRFLSVMSVIRFVKPCMIVIHGNSIPTGEYWRYIINFYPKIIISYRPTPRLVGSTNLAYTTHASDIMRIEALINYGGIYIDTDEVVLKSIDHLRNYEHTQGYESTSALSSGFVIAKRNSTFARMWYDSYFSDYKNQWGYNALVVPARLARRYTELIHTVGGKFIDPGPSHTDLVYKQNYNWSENYGIHFYQFAVTANVTIKNVRTLNTTLGSVSRFILFGSKELCLH